jgi:hypothetical protein
VLNEGDTVLSPGKTFVYRIVGPVCRLYDREELPYPHCSIQFRCKMPSWNRIGKRFVPDRACIKSPSYSVILLGGYQKPETVTTLHWMALTSEEQDWWYTPKPHFQHWEHQEAA